jgi:hypothetical protein
MTAKSIYIVYLCPDITNERWSNLHRFFHPGILEHDKKNALVCFSLDTSYHGLLVATARDFSTDKNKKIHFLYSMVDSIIEVSFPRTPIGFLHTKESLEQLENESDES